MKTFKRIPLSNHDYLFIVNYAPDRSFKLRYCYNQISGGYMGTQIICFFEVIRGVNNIIPDFLEQFDDMSPLESLKGMGFVEVDATELEFKMYAE